MNNNYMKTKENFNFVQFKKFFLLEFTKQLIKHSASSEIFELQTALEKEREYKLEEERAKIKEIMKQRKREVSKKPLLRKTEEIRSILHPSIGMFGNREVPHINPFKQSFRRAVHSIPELRFPVHLQYIKPVLTNREIELGKIDPLIKDSKVRIIECHGAGENIVVQGSMGTKKTKIILNKEEIEKVIQKFSKETKIPTQEGVFRVVIGRLVFLAIISEIVGSKFIIKKMLYNPIV